MLTGFTFTWVPRGIVFVMNPLGYHNDYVAPLLLLLLVELSCCPLVELLQADSRQARIASPKHFTLDHLSCNEYWLERRLHNIVNDIATSNAYYELLVI